MRAAREARLEAREAQRTTSGKGAKGSRKAGLFSRLKARRSGGAKGLKGKSSSSSGGGGCSSCGKGGGDCKGCGSCGGSSGASKNQTQFNSGSPGTCPNGQCNR